MNDARVLSGMAKKSRRGGAGDGMYLCGGVGEKFQPSGFIVATEAEIAFPV